MIADWIDVNHWKAEHRGCSVTPNYILNDSNYRYESNGEITHFHEFGVIESLFITEYRCIMARDSYYNDFCCCKVSCLIVSRGCMGYSWLHLGCIDGKVDRKISQVAFPSNAKMLSFTLYLCRGFYTYTCIHKFVTQDITSMCTFALSAWKRKADSTLILNLERIQWYIYKYRMNERETGDWACEWRSAL